MCQHNSAALPKKAAFCSEQSFQEGANKAIGRNKQYAGKLKAEAVNQACKFKRPYVR